MTEQEKKAHAQQQQQQQEKIAALIRNGIPARRVEFKEAITSLGGGGTSLSADANDKTQIVWTDTGVVVCRGEVRTFIPHSNTKKTELV